MNRLQLNFQLQTRSERLTFIQDYLQKIRFTPNESELDIMAKYILWGKDSETGLNGRQEGLELETKYGTWDTNKIESLDALIENPNFSETMLKGPSDPPTKISREVFSRSEARKNAPPHILSALEQLWKEIDKTELLINFYDLAHNKRKNPPRQTLLDKFSPEEQQNIKSLSEQTSPYNYLKLKHSLVEMRREQYTYRDSFNETHLSRPTFNFNEGIGPTFGEEILVRPIGLPFKGELGEKIFREDRFPEPEDFREEELISISKILWDGSQYERKEQVEKPEKLAYTAAGTKKYFDFTNTDHLYALFSMWEELEEPEDSIYSNRGLFMRAAMVYRKLSNLDPILEDILDLKIQKVQNQDIVNFINQKYGKKYRANYISTLYCKKCLEGIAQTARRHREVLENIFFPENFKKCKDCGRVLLMDEINFVKRARSSDGFSPRCKKCEKIKRIKVKEQRNGIK